MKGNRISRAIPWSKIEELFCSGQYTVNHLSQMFDVPPSSINRKKKELGWETPAMLRAKAKKLLAEADKAEGVEGLSDVDWAKVRRDHRKEIAQIINEFLADKESIQNIKIETIRDLEVLDKIQRRNSGMDLEDQANMKALIDYNALDSLEGDE